MIDPNNPIFVHSDIGRGLLIAKRAGMRINPKNICSSLLDFLNQQVGKDFSRLLFPAFNYDYGDTRIFRPDVDPVQVGALPEWVRNNCGFSRSDIPFFSALSKSNLALNSTDVINPFGVESVFGWLVAHDATLVLFGADLSSLTFIHHVEELAGKPVYRYEKSFPGQIIRGEDINACEFTMHVRPMGIHMDYAWQRLEQDLISDGILKVERYSHELKHIKAVRLLEYWGNRILDDPFYLLDTQSKAYFEVKTELGLRRIRIEEFENREVSYDRQ